MWYAESLHIPVPLILSQFTFLVRIHPHTRGRSRQQDSPSPWTAATRVQLAGPGIGHRVGTNLFKYVFGVTEIPTTCTPHISAMPLC